MRVFMDAHEMRASTQLLRNTSRVPDLE